MAGKVIFGARDVRGGRKQLFTLLSRHGINAMEMDPVIKSESLREQTLEQLKQAETGFPSPTPLTEAEVINGILTEAGEFLITEDNDFLIQE